MINIGDRGVIDHVWDHHAVINRGQCLDKWLGIPGEWTNYFHTPMLGYDKQ